MSYPRKRIKTAEGFCPLCGSGLKESGEKWNLPGGERYIHCTHCDLIFLEARLRPDRESERARYLEHNNSPLDERYRAYLSGFAHEALTPFVASPADILDFGSGPEPVFATVLEELGYRVDIYDPLFAPDRSWQEKSYDAVTMVEVAEHLFEPLEELRRVRSVLRPGGYLVLRTLLHYSDRERFRSWWYRKDCTHVCFYSPRSFEVAAGLLDLEVVEIKEGRSVILRG